MKKYIAPEMAVSLFDSESIVTLVSDTGKTSAFETAKSVFDGSADAGDMSDMDPVAHTFIVDLGK